MNFFKNLFGGGGAGFGSENFAGQITDRSVKWLLDHLGSVRTEIRQFIEPTHEVYPEQAFLIPNLLGEFNEPAMGIVHGEGGGHAFIRVDMLRDIVRTHPGQIHDYATLVRLFRERGSENGSLMLAEGTDRQKLAGNTDYLSPASSRDRRRSSMSTTRSNWTSDHPRFVIDLNGDGRADVLGIGPDCVWSCLNRGPTGFGAPTFQLVAFEANSGWRTRRSSPLSGRSHRRRPPRSCWFRRCRRLDRAWQRDGSSRPVAFVLDELGFNKGWSVEFPRFVADLTGDGRADIGGFGRDGIWTALSNGDGSFQPARMVSADLDFNTGWRVDKHPRFVTDLTGDRRADILGFGDDGAWVALGNGDGGFQGARFVLAELGFNQGWRVDSHPRFLADLTGDGRPDILGFGNDGVWVALNNGDGNFQPARFVSTDFGFNTGWRVDKHPRFVADLTGDGKADIMGFGDDGILGRFGQWRRQLPARSNGIGGFLLQHRLAGRRSSTLPCRHGWRRKG